MDFSWSDGQLAVRAEMAAFARAHLSSDVRTRDRELIFPRELWRACGEAGLLGLNVPPELGGRGYTPITTALALEGLGYGCRDRGLSFAVSAQVTSVGSTLAEFGSPSLQRRLLPDLCTGIRLGCYAMSEPDTGSDAFALKATARPTDRGYVLDGEKAFITFAPIADFALVFASTSLERGPWGISLFLVERGTPGFSTGPTQEKLGLRTVPIGTVSLRECEVPRDHLIGREGAGVSIFNRSQEWERICILASEIGAMEYQLEQCIEFARTRRAFGQSIGRFQAVSQRIVEMKLRLDTSRLLTYRAAWLKERGRPVTLDASLAKLHVSESALSSSHDSMRIHGARGYLTEYEIERDLRDSAGGPIYGGTSDIQRNIIARLLGL